jgi:glycosyltransferase involved in cell wall biosynthesis
MNLDAPIVSVIIPCYNQGRYLDEAVGSILAQTLQEFEIIVVNDGSTEPETIALLQNYSKPKLTIIHTENRGPASARNTGITQARGRYILPLDADDRIAPTYLEKAVPVLDANPAVGIVYSEAEFFGEETGKFDLPCFSFPQILLGNMIFNSSLYRHLDWEKVGGYKDHFHWEDYEFWLSLIELGREVVQLPEVLYFHRQLKNSRGGSLNRQKWLEDYVHLYHAHTELYSENIRVLFEHIIDMREDVHQTHARLHQTQIQLESTQAQLNQVQATLSEIQNSKLGRLYAQYVRLKQLLGWGTGSSP